MTKKEALGIVIQASINDISGAGKGFRSTSDEWRIKVREAIKKLWKDHQGHEITESEIFNNHLY